MKRLLTLAASALVVLGLLALPAQTQSYATLYNSNPVQGALGADDTDVALLVKYIGTNAGGGEVDVAAGGDITFTVAAGADTTFECPVSGALGGIIDVSNAACDTLGEVVDIINTSTSDFRAVILDGLRTDSSNDTLLDSTADADALGGLELKWDTSVVFTSTIALTPWRTIDDYLAADNKLIKNKYLGTRAVMFIANATSTYGSGTSAYSAVSALAENKNGYLGTETVTTHYSTAAGATTVNAEFSHVNFGLYGKRDCKMVVRLTNSAAMASTVHYVYGLHFNYGH